MKNLKDKLFAAYVTLVFAGVIILDIVIIANH